MSSENRDHSWTRGNALLPSKLAAATLIAALALGMWGGGCAPVESGDGGGAGSMSSEHAEAELYTCAMHPHIILNQPGNCPICGMELVPVATESGGVSDEAMRLSPYAAALARVETAVVERRPVTIDVRLVGKLAYDETRVRTVSAWLPGRIDRLYVDFVGVAVNAGDH